MIENHPAIILTRPGDIHAHAVTLGMERLGGSAEAVHLCGLPFDIDAKFEISSRGNKYDVRIDSLINPNGFVFWNRRRGHVRSPLGIHPEDEKIAQEQCNRFVDTLALILDLHSVMSVNDYATFHVAERAKALQLIAAKKCGLRIPDTLVANTPEDIHSFIDRNHGRAIHKPLSASVWESDGQPTHWATTILLDQAKLPSDRLLRAAPGIYQNAIEKQYEIRAHVIGHTVVSARLNVPSMNSEHIDWRTNQDSLDVTPYQLPEEVEHKLIRTLGELGLVFGCVDLIVDKNGDYIFLEVNQMGQFLWVEEKCPDIPLLDLFCRFLMSGDPTFKDHARDDRLALSMVAADSYEKSYDERTEKKQSLPA